MDGFSVRHIAANGCRAGFFRNFCSGFLFLFIEEEYPVAPGSKQFHCGSANTPGTAGNDYMFHILNTQIIV
jgi:hypothetical protein